MKTPHDLTDMKVSGILCDASRKSTDATTEIKARRCWPLDKSSDDGYVWELIVSRIQTCVEYLYENVVRLFVRNLLICKF